MQYNLTAFTAKGQARALVKYMSEIRRRIPLSDAFEAIARMHNSRDWNTLAALLDSESPGDGRSSNARFMGVTSTGVVELPVIASVRTKGHMHASFDASLWLMREEAGTLLQFASMGWSCEFDLGQLIRDHGSADAQRLVGQAKPATRQAPGEYSLSLDKEQVLRFCRAFRLGVFAKLMLADKFLDLDGARHHGNYVASDPDQPGRWIWRAGPDASDVSFDTEDAAWADMGRYFDVCWAEEDEEEIFNIERGSGLLQAIPSVASPTSAGKVAGRFDERGNSGQVMVLRPQQPHLTKKQLREITNDGEFRIQIAVSIGMGTLIDADGIEPINDLVTELICGDSASLADLSYERYSPESETTLHDTAQNVFILVNAEWAPFDDMYDEGEESSEANDDAWNDSDGHGA